MAKAKVRKTPTIMSPATLKKDNKNNIYNKEQFTKIMDKGAKGCTTSIAKSTGRTLHLLTKSLIYDSYNPKIYQRTYQLLNSIVWPGNGGAYTSGGNKKFSAEVKFDIDKMQIQKWSTRNGWGVHTDYKMRDRRAELIDRFERQTFRRWPKGYLTLGEWQRSEMSEKNQPPVYVRQPVGMIDKTEKAVANALSKTYDNSRSFAAIAETFSNSLVVAGIERPGFTKEWWEDLPF